MEKVVPHLRLVTSMEQAPPETEEQAMLAAAIELLRVAGENIRQTLMWYDQYQDRRTG